jgi:hypothetical protein
MFRKQNTMSHECSCGETIFIIVGNGKPGVTQTLHPGPVEENWTAITSHSLGSCETLVEEGSGGESGK